MPIAMPVPVTMVGRIDECLLLSYRVASEAVEHLVPKPLELVTHKGFAFFNIVVCHIDRMRPRGVPAWGGVSYHHVAYRLMVRAQRGDGTAFRGLYFLRSDADSGLVSLGGNLASEFRFNVAEVSLGMHDGVVSAAVRSRDGVGDASLEVDTGCSPELREDSIFETMELARSVLKYAPMGLAPRGDRRVALAEVFRDELDWDERVVGVSDARWAFFDSIGESLGIEPPVLELATRVAPIDYRWRLGRTERVAG
mgnify:CR=1 FL=1